MIRGYLLVLMLLLSSRITAQNNAHELKRGAVRFKSDAPLEVIEASSKSLRGQLNLTERTFVFSVDIHSFYGFKSSLQREHFKGSFMDSRLYRTATYAGKIIEKDDLTKDGAYTIRTKGKLTLHGITKEQIIKNEVTVKNGNIYVRSNFTVLLDDHAINIPKILSQKIAKEIAVEVEADFGISY